MVKSLQKTLFQFQFKSLFIVTVQINLDILGNNTHWHCDSTCESQINNNTVVL